MLSEEEMAINRLECGNTAHSRNADYIQLAIKALKKQVPVKPVSVCRSGGVIRFFPCPNCSTPEKYVPVYPSMAFCNYCGQKLDWGD